MTLIIGKALGTTGGGLTAVKHGFFGIACDTAEIPADQGLFFCICRAQDQAVTLAAYQIGIVLRNLACRFLILSIHPAYDTAGKEVAGDIRMVCTGGKLRLVFAVSEISIACDAADAIMRHGSRIRSCVLVRLVSRQLYLHRAVHDKRNKLHIAQLLEGIFSCRIFLRQDTY